MLFCKNNSYVASAVPVHVFPVCVSPVINTRLCYRQIEQVCYFAAVGAGVSVCATLMFKLPSTRSRTSLTAKHSRHAANTNVQPGLQSTVSVAWAGACRDTAQKWQPSAPGRGMRTELHISTA